VIGCLLAAAGCAAPARLGEAPGVARPAAPDSGLVVLEVRMRRSAEVADGRGGFRVFDQDLRAEYRAGGKGPGLEAGDVTLDGKPLRRVGEGKGVSYRMGREEQEGGAPGVENPWVSIAATGGPGVPGGAVRVKLAPYPIVTQPVPGQGVARTDELPVVMLPPVADVWYRVSLGGTGDAVNAIDMGEGRWLFPRGTLTPLGPGRAKLLIEVESTCADCPGVGLLRANWSTRTELELALTLL
jgi:hypothetical protein